MATVRGLWKVDGTIVVVTIKGDTKVIIDKVFDSIDEDHEFLPNTRANRNLYELYFPETFRR